MQSGNTSPTELIVNSLENEEEIIERNDMCPRNNYDKKAV